MPARVFVTGGTGFIGLQVVRQLRERGDEVVVVVRDPSSATELRATGAKLVQGDLSTEADIRSAMAGSDAVIHAAGVYRIGIAAAERPAMYEANVAVTQRVLDAAIAIGVPRIVDVSTVNVFGNTMGRIVDETFRHDPADGFLSYYDETKYLAHLATQSRIESGAPIAIVQPGTTYGRRDHAAAGAQLKAAFDGRLSFLALADVGVSWTYVDDLARGILAALDRGRIGEAYVMAGENMRLREAMAIAAAAGGQRLPRLTVPNVIIRIGARLAPGGGALIGQPPNLREIVSASAGVTYWASSAKAAAELGYATRDLATGARDAFGPSTRL